MGLFDRVKGVFGRSGGSDARVPPSSDGRAHKKGQRPPLKDPPSSASATLEDALAAREAGDRDRARAILAAIDRGKGLRTVLRAAAALESEDEEELALLLPAVAAGGAMLALQIAAALSGRDEDAVLAAKFAERGRAEQAPVWALAWVKASSREPSTRRVGMVDLLFADAALARTVAAREWKVEGAVSDGAAVERYASFAHGRDTIGRFGAVQVASVFERASVKVHGAR
jgi:hypothetical protein